MDKTAIAIAAATILAGTQPAVADDKPAVEFLNSGKVVPNTLPFSEAVRAGDTLYLSGQVGIKPGTMQLVPAASAKRPARRSKTSRPRSKPTATRCETSSSAR
jgi:enamine deaminase RidA (YjgF/YER057c/UK114 family)